VDWILIGWIFGLIKRQVAGMRILELVVETIFFDEFTTNPS
jgi:hypothetical protein